MALMGELGSMGLVSDIDIRGAIYTICTDRSKTKGKNAILHEGI